MFPNPTTKLHTFAEMLQQAGHSAVAFERSKEYVPIRGICWRRFRIMLQRFPGLTLAEQLKTLQDSCTEAPPGGRLWILLKNGCNLQMVVKRIDCSLFICFNEEPVAQYTGQKAALSLQINDDGSGVLVWVQRGKQLSGKIMMGLFMLIRESMAVSRWTLNDTATLRIGSSQIPLRLYRCLSKGNSWFGRFGFIPKSRTPGQPGADSFWAAVERLQDAMAPARFRMSLGQTFESLRDLDNPRAAQMLTEVLLDLKYRADLKADLDRVIQTKVWEYISPQSPCATPPYDSDHPVRESCSSSLESSSSTSSSSSLLY